MVFTDPPYNVDYGANANPPSRIRSIENDAMSREDWLIFVDKWMKQIISLSNGGIYICMSDKELSTIKNSFEANGGHWSGFIVWVKDIFVLGLKDYHSRHETLLYVWAKTVKNHAYYGGRDKDDVWEIKRPRQNNEHPTMKPVELVECAVSNSSQQNGLVYDPFLGSGTTLIACHNLNRRCRGIEISPAYVAVTLQRFKDHTGIKPILITNGDTL